MITDAAQRFYATHSPFSDPGEWAERLETVPGDLRSIKEAAHQLVFHYRADGDWAEHGIAPERIGEIDSRYAERMLGRVVELADRPLTEPRAARERLVGCCRDFTVFFVALARQHGIPARMRVGFATYFLPGWNADHVVAEVWDAGEGRWRLVDAELREGHADPNDGRVLDPLDLTRDRFIVGPEAWRRCRAGEAEPETFVVAPDLDIPATRSWPYLLHNVVHDLAALNKREMILWDDWGITEGWETITDEQLALLDEAASIMLAPDIALDDLQRLYERAEFRVPEVVTSYTSAVEIPPIQVRLERVTDPATT